MIPLTRWTVKNYSKVRVRGTKKGGLAMLFHSIPPFVIFRVPWKSRFGNRKFRSLHPFLTD